MQKILKKRLSSLLVLIMIMTITPVTPITKVMADTLTYIDADGNEWAYDIDRSTGFNMDGSTYIVSPASSTSVSGAAIIPSTINGKTVTSF